MHTSLFIVLVYAIQGFHVFVVDSAIILIWKFAEDYFSNPYPILHLLQRWLEQGRSSALVKKNDVSIESLVLLLKCMKIMENATFLSDENQVRRM